MTRKLSRAQFDALRYAKGRQLYAADVNEGNGNLRRTLLWLIDHGLLGWDLIYHGRLVLTDLGTQKLAEAREKERARVRGTIDDPESAVRIAKSAHLDPPGTLRIRDVGDRRVITLTGVHEEKP